MAVLYIVATPIGNLEDITLRALRILKEVDFVLCEDTRVSRKLLDHYQIITPTLSYHQHSNEAKIKQIIDLLRSGKNLALVTDAGTPDISDPGGVLVNAALAIDCQIIPIPGPSALTAAISISGLPMDKFLFLGFLPHKKGRQTLLKKISESEYPVVLYESVHRINKLLAELERSRLNLSGGQHSSSGQHLSSDEYQLVVCRELTKKFETVYRGTIEEVKNQLKEQETKGEFVVIINKHG